MKASPEQKINFYRNEIRFVQEIKSKSVEAVYARCPKLEPFEEEIPNLLPVVGETMVGIFYQSQLFRLAGRIKEQLRIFNRDYLVGTAVD